jgi:hypothetical protein
MSLIQFTRDQLTTIFSRELPLPPGVNPIAAVMHQEPELPALCQSREPLEYRPTRGGRSAQVRADIRPTDVCPAANRLALPSKPGEAAAPSKPAAAPPKAPTPPPLPSKPGQPAPPPPALAWYYKDPQDAVRGPFKSDQLRKWWSKGQFPPTLEISVSTDPDSFREITAFFPDLTDAFAYNPLLFPFMGTVEPDPNDPLERIFRAFQEKLAEQ